MKRLRAPNFTQNDNILLCDLVDKHKHIIENKKTDGATLRQKQKAWLEVEKKFNSSTTGCFRTVESLLQNYKNLKRKVKKIAPDKKPDNPADKSTSANNTEECGTSSQSFDWRKVALSTGVSEETCKEMFAALAKQANAIDTGGGPPHNTDPVLERIKALTVPVLDGDNTIYDGDSSPMVTQDEPSIELGSDRLSDIHNSTERVDSENETYLTKETVADKFELLATENMGLLELQKELVRSQLQEQRDQAEHNRMLRTMEMEDARKKYMHNEKLREMEIEELKTRNEFNEKMRQFEIRHP